MKQSNYLAVAALTSVLHACVSTNADVPRGHPANPSSPTTPVALSPTLKTMAAAPPESPPDDEQPIAGMAHHHHGGAMPASSDAAAPPKAVDGAKESASPAAADVWTCSMHPQVSKSGPGQCPICGMNLVKRPAGKDAK